MDLEGEDGSKIAVRSGSKAVFGRVSGFNTNDRTVSRRHLLLEFRNPVDKSDGQAGPRVSFEVLGKNPVWVRSRGDGDVRVFRRADKGEVAAGDRLCVSGKSPVWFELKGIELKEEKNVLEDQIGVAESLDVNAGLEGVDVSDFDPVKEFGFLVIGHEFDQYPKKRLYDVKDWDWFLEGEKGSDDDDEDEVLDKRRKRTIRKKRRKDEGNDDKDWKGESEDDKDLIGNRKKVRRPSYSTRSKDRENAKKSKALSQKKTIPPEEDESEDEYDETLGGFIVDDDAEVEDTMDEDEDEDEEEEEEEEEEDYNDDDGDE